MRLVFLVSIILFLSGCAVGHKPWVDYKNEDIGKKAIVLDPTRFGNLGELIRGDFLISGKGFTHVTIDQNGDTIQHWDLSEVLPVFAIADPSWMAGDKKWVGKCLIYYVIDSKTHTIKSWGFDKDSNPLSCRIWP